jgi:hypothetical protein
MILRGFLRRFRAGDPVAKVCDHEHHNRVAEILENAQGCGCRLDKPTDGTPWTVIVDGSTDIPFPNGAKPQMGWPWGEQYTFGITQTAEDKIKVWKGKMDRWGDEQNGAGPYVAADTEVTFEGDGTQYLIWKWSESSGLEILTTPQVNWPLKFADGYIFGVIHQVKLYNKVFSLVDGIQAGMLPAPMFTKPGA